MGAPRPFVSKLPASPRGRGGMVPGPASVRSCGTDESGQSSNSAKMRISTLSRGGTSGGAVGFTNALCGTGSS